MQRLIMILRPSLVKSLRKRWTEWVLAYASLLIGALFLYGQDGLFVDPKYHELARVAPAWVWGLAFSVLGVSRFIVLYVNGLWPPSYMIRVILSIISLPLWYNLLLLYWTNKGIVLLPGVVLTQLPLLLEGSCIVFAVHERFEYLV
jgi:hypothetical protein